jgi:hypothetical protein
MQSYLPGNLQPADEHHRRSRRTLAVSHHEPFILLVLRVIEPEELNPRRVKVVHLSGSTFAAWQPDRGSELGHDVTVSLPGKRTGSASVLPWRL